MMMIYEKEKWHQLIFNDLKELSDKDLQVRVWIKGDTEYVSSYEELMCSLFDDNYFDDYLDVYWKDLDINDQTKSKLHLLRNMLNEYSKGDKSELEMINDPKWNEIIELADVLVQEYGSYLVKNKNRI
jgi:hypothetical protein